MGWVGNRGLEELAAENMAPALVEGVVDGVVGRLEL